MFPVYCRYVLPVEPAHCHHLQAVPRLFPGEQLRNSVTAMFIRDLLHVLDYSSTSTCVTDATSNSTLYRSLAFLLMMSALPCVLCALLLCLFLLHLLAQTQTSVYASFKRRTVALRAAFEVLRKHPSSAG